MHLFECVTVAAFVLSHLHLIAYCTKAMDISLIEEKMEESIKHIYELNSVVRMSLIEMQVREKVDIDSITNACLFFLG